MAFKSDRQRKKVMVTLNKNSNTSDVYGASKYKIGTASYFLKNVNDWLLNVRSSPNNYTWSFKDDKFGDRGIFEVYKSAKTGKWNAVHIPVTGSDKFKGRNLSEQDAIDKAIEWMGIN